MVTSVRFLNIRMQDFLCLEVCMLQIMKLLISLGYKDFIIITIHVQLGILSVLWLWFLNCHLHSRGWMMFCFLEAELRNLNKNWHSQYCLFWAAWWVYIETRFIKCSMNYILKKRGKEISFYVAKLAIYTI